MSETVSERPTFAQAFASEAPAAESLPATPSPESQPAASASADTTVPPADQTTGDVTPAEGPVPYARFKEVNEGKKALEDKLTALQWAESVDRGAVERASQLGQLYQRDRAGYIRQVLAEAVTNPDLAPLVRSEAARVLGARQPQPDADIEPDIPVVNDQGQVVSQAFSAERVKQFVQRAVTEALTKEVGPLKQTVQSVEQERQQAVIRQQAEQAAAADYQRAQAWPGFTEHQDAIAQAFAEHADWSIQDAYIAVAVPKLQAAAEAKTLEALKTKAAASTVNPAAAVVTSQARPASFHDPRLSW